MEHWKFLYVSWVQSCMQQTIWKLEVVTPSSHTPVQHEQNVHKRVFVNNILILFSWRVHRMCTIKDSNPSVHEDFFVFLVYVIYFCIIRVIFKKISAQIVFGLKLINIVYRQNKLKNTFIILCRALNFTKYSLPVSCNVHKMYTVDFLLNHSVSCARATHFLNDK